VSSSTTSKRTASTPQGQGRQRLLLALGGLVVLAFIVGIAVLSTGERGSRVTVDELAGSPTITGEPLAPGGQDANDPEVGSEAPVVAGAGFDGNPVTIGEPGTPQLIMFMASWCPACQEELRSVAPWLEDGGLRDDVELVAVSTGLDDTRPNWPPTDWFESEGFDGPILVDDADGSVAQAYGLTATPFWVGLDAEGRVVARAAGMLPIEQIEALADAVAGGPA
jgi:cytochrome c biogenesis protein CcmG, thiol:disulfide interchange protein DsbE